MDVAYPSVRYAGDSLKHPSKLTPLILLDLPLSAALDTAMLPFDAAKDRRPSRRPKIGQSVSAAPLTKEESAMFIEVAIRKRIKKPVGELTKADLEKMSGLVLSSDQLTDVKGLEKLTQLQMLSLYNNQLTDVKGLENLTQLTQLYLDGNQLTNVKGLEKLTQLETLNLTNNPDLTKAQIDQLQKALPKCAIISNPTK